MIRKLNLRRQRALSTGNLCICRWWSKINTISCQIYRDTCDSGEGARMDTRDNIEKRKNFSAKSNSVTYLAGG